MAEFEPCFNKVIMLEGGYNLHEVPGDRGGMTYAGIARNRWQKWPGWGKVDAGDYDSDLTSMVRIFYKENFWDRLKGDDIDAQDVAYHLYAFSINAGLRVAVRIAQRIIGATPDGVFGEKSFSLLNGLIQDEKDEKIFVLMFNLMKIFRYKDICMNDRRRGNDHLVSNQKFLCGWINRVQGGLE